MNQYLSSLEAAVRAVDFPNDFQFTWFGALSEAIDRRVRHGLLPETIHGFLHYQLRETLYNQFYTKGAPGTRADEADWTSEDTSFVAALVAANRGSGSVENGWVPREVRAGRLVIERRGLALEVAPEKCVAADSQPLAFPPEVALRVPNTRPNLSAGYHVVVSDVPMSHTNNTVRLYWHLTPTCAADWVRCVTDTLNTDRVPFRLKVLRSPLTYMRCDAGVLYLPRFAFEAVKHALTMIYAQVEAQLGPQIPAFTHRLAPGLGLAESPARDSFGLNRCDLIANGLLRSRIEGRTDLTGRLGCVLDCWTEAGVQIEHPYLNPGSEDMYARLSPLIQRSRGSALPERDSTISPSACLDVALEIGTSLARDAIWDGDLCTWLSAERLEAGVVSYGTSSCDVYSGTAGIALFLAALWRVARVEAIRQAAIGAIRQTLTGLEPLAETNLAGLYTGALGVCAAVVRAAISLEEAQLVDNATGRLAHCRRQAVHETEDRWDLMSGWAGGILALLGLRRCLKDDSLLQWASSLGTALIAAGTRDRMGRLRWQRPPRHGARALTGYSHGAAGAGIALLELGKAVGDQVFEEAGLAAFAYEHRQYDPEQANWPDFRGGYNQKRFSTTWCHGAPGIALSRFRAMQLAPSSQIEAELQVAMQTTTRNTAAMLNTPGTGFCLCHGLAGNAEVLNVCTHGGAPELSWQIAARASRTFITKQISSAQERDLALTPGLMLGQAGVGHFYLRLFDPSVPSVLLPYY